MARLHTRHCPWCRLQTVHLNRVQAAQAADVSRRTIDNWVRREWIHGMENASGRMHICAESISRPKGPAKVAADVNK